MKRCPACQRTFTEETQKFCASDGTPLVTDEPSGFDPEATVISSATKPKEKSADLDLMPTQYFSAHADSNQPRAENIDQSNTPPEQGGSPVLSPPPPQQYQPTPPPEQQPPYYPQPAPPGGQPPAPQWQAAPQTLPPPPWMPGGQPPQGQQQWGGGAYPPPGQFAPPAGKSMALSLITLIAGLLGFVNWALVFGMWNRIIPPDRSVAEVVVYVMLSFGILALLLGIVTLISSRWRSKALAAIGLLIGLPGIIFFVYLAAEGKLP